MSFGTPVAKLIDVRSATAAIVLGLTASLTACARPGNTPSGTPTATSRTVTVWATAAPAPPIGLVPSRLATTPGPACGSSTTGVRKPPATTPDPQISPESEAAARARRALEAANPPVPRRGPVPDEAAAESCARTLRMELTLLTSGRGETPQEPALRRTLTAMGLSGITVGAGSAFAASTGTACVYGTFTADGPELSIGPLGADGTCRS